MKAASGAKTVSSSAEAPNPPTPTADRAAGVVLFPPSPGFTPCGPRFSPDGQSTSERESLLDLPKPSPHHASLSACSSPASIIHVWSPRWGAAFRRSVACETDPGVEEEASEVMRVQLRRKEWELEDAHSQIARCGTPPPALPHSG